MNLFQKKHDWILGGFEFLRADTTVETDPGSGGSLFAVDANGATLHPYAKMEFGASGTQTPVSAANPLPIVQTGTPGLPTGAATAAKQPAIGTAGASSADVISVQGIASGTAMPVSLASVPSHAVTNAGVFAAQIDGAALTALQLIDNIVAVEDAAAAGGESGIPVLAVRRDSASSGVSTDGDFANLSVDATGALRVTGAGGTQYAEDTAHVSGDLMTMAGAVRRDANTSLVGTDGDIAPLQVNAAGALKTDGSAVTQPVSDAGGSITTDTPQLPAALDGSGNLKVAIMSGAGSGGTAMTDDAAFTPASTSITPVGGIYRSTLDAVDDGDAGAFAMTANRAVHVNLRDASGNELTSGAQYAEDAAHVSGDFVTMAGVVRQDTATQLAGTDGDNSVLVNDANGRLHVNGSGVTQPVSDAGGSLTFDSPQLPAALVGGRLDTVIGDALPAGSNAIGTVTAVGGAAHDAAVSGNPVLQGLEARTSDGTAVANGDAVRAQADLNGKQVILPYAIPENSVSGAITSAMTGTTSTSLVAAPGSGLRNYITTIIVSNSHATVGTDVVIQDGSGGTTLLTIPAGAVYGGAVITLPTPLRQPTANTALYCANVTTGASTKVSAVGFRAV